MAGLSGEEQRQIEAGALKYLQELNSVAPDLVAQGAALSGGAAPPDAVFLGKYTESLGQLATAKFSDSVQALLEEEADTDTGFLQSGDNGRPIGHFVLKAFQKRLCNPVTEAGLKAEIAKAKKDHGVTINPTAAGISGSAATAVAVSVGAVMGSGPLAIVLAPLAGSVALLLLLVGVDTFCSWASSQDE